MKGDAVAAELAEVVPKVAVVDAVLGSKGLDRLVVVY